jgi:hypothetical protein
VGFLYGAGILGAAFAAIGLFVSLITDNQIIAFLFSVVICLLPGWVLICLFF